MSVRIEQQGRVVTVILDRPQARNAVDRPTAEALAAAFRAFEADDSADVAVLWGAGGTFCAGADLKALADPVLRNRVELDGDGPMGCTRLQLSKPVIAAVAGHAVAGGLELACWCDLRVAEDNAVFGVFCRRWGVPLVDGGTIRLPRLIGESRALDLILTGRPVSADEALRIGLANRLVAKGQSRVAAEALALELTRFPQTCLRNDRRSTLAQAGRSLEQALIDETALGLQTLASGETQRRAARFAAGHGRGGDFSDL